MKKKPRGALFANEGVQGCAILFAIGIFLFAELQSSLYFGQGPVLLFHFSAVPVAGFIAYRLKSLRLDTFGLTAVASWLMVLLLLFIGTKGDEEAKKEQAETIKLLRYLTPAAAILGAGWWFGATRCEAEGCWSSAETGIYYHSQDRLKGRRFNFCKAHFEKPPEEMRIRGSKPRF